MPLSNAQKKNCAGTSEKEVQTPLASLYKFCQMLAGFDGKWSLMVVKCTCIAVNFFAVRGCNSHVVHFESIFLETEQQMVMVSILANLNYDSFIFVLTSKNWLVITFAVAQILIFTTTVILKQQNCFLESIVLTPSGTK